MVGIWRGHIRGLLFRDRPGRLTACSAEIVDWPELIREQGVEDGIGVSTRGCVGHRKGTCRCRFYQKTEMRGETGFQVTKRSRIGNAASGLRTHIVGLSWFKPPRPPPPMRTDEHH